MACRGAAAFVTPSTAHHQEAADNMGVSRKMYSQGDFPSNENWGFWRNGRGDDRRTFDDPLESYRDSDGRMNDVRDNEMRGDYNDYYDGPDPTFGVQQYQQQYREEDDFERQNSFRGYLRQEYFSDEPRYPFDSNVDDDYRGDQRYRDVSDNFSENQRSTQTWDGSRVGEQEQYRTEDLDRTAYIDFERQESFRGNFGRRGFDGRQQYNRDEPRSLYELQDDDNYRGQPQRYMDKNGYQHAYDRKRRPWDDTSQYRGQEQYQPSGIVRDKPFGLGAMERMADSVFRPFAGLEMMDLMMNNMIMDPFSGFGMMNQMMDRFSFEIETRMNQDRVSIEGLLDDAYDCIRADPAVADMLGDRIQLGMPFAESSSSVTINGVRRNRLELVIPVTGSEGEGRVRLLAEQDGISLLEVNVGGRIIDVRVGKRSIYDSRNDIDDAIIDANVVDKQVY